METRFKEHAWQLRLYQAEKSAVVEYSIELDHKMKFKDTKDTSHNSRFCGLSC
jgi:hypothetical protein